jgi:hypothetical protein
MYPETTTFYAAKVSSSCTTAASSPDLIRLEFEGDEPKDNGGDVSGPCPPRPVAFRHIAQSMPLRPST